MIPIPVAGILWIRRGCFLQLVGYLLSRRVGPDGRLPVASPNRGAILLEFDRPVAWIMLRPYSDVSLWSGGAILLLQASEPSMEYLQSYRSSCRVSCLTFQGFPGV